MALRNNTREVVPLRRTMGVKDAHLNLLVAISSAMKHNPYELVRGH
jgi:hypothetical protein